MSILTKCIGAAKKVKHHFQDQIRERTPVYLSPVRRIEQVALKERICAMTFDDGPCNLPANPDDFGGKPLTLVLAETLERHGAKGTFDVVGDTSSNYPDQAGQHGSASWGGIAYDHYPDYGKDDQGGVVHCPQLVSRLLEQGHEITSHTYAHVLFGWKPLVYGKRKFLPDLTAVTDDLKKLHDLMEEKWNYKIRLSRPPHYVDGIKGGYTSYDAYAQMGYQYMAASFDGAGWLPLESYEAEVDATVAPIERVLANDPDALCGQIIFQKDGYNMARRSPVAHGLERQLEVLDRYGYKVVTVSELLERSAFLDVPADDCAAAAARQLMEQGWCVAYRDNTLRIDNPLTRGELAMMAYGWKAVNRRIELAGSGKAPFRDLKARHPYAAAAQMAVEEKKMDAPDRRFEADKEVTREDLEKFFGAEIPELNQPVTHGAFLCLAAQMLK